MFVIPRKMPKLYKGYKLILEDGTPEIPTWKRFTGSKIVDDDPAAAVQHESEKRNGDDGLVDAPLKKMKLA